MNNQRGAMVLGLAIVVTIISIVVFYNASNRTAAVAFRARKAQAMNYAHQISAGLARKIRYSYDIAKARAADPTNQQLCDGAGGAIVTVGSVNLCVFGGRICINHPQPAGPNLPGIPVCVTPGTDLVAFQQREMHKRNSMIAFLLLGNSAEAAVHTPALPPAGENQNFIGIMPYCIGPSCIISCQGTAGTVNADCLTFRFCPLASGNCEPDEIVTQTIGFPL